MTRKVRRLFTDSNVFNAEIKGSIKDKLVEMGYCRNVRYRKIRESGNRVDYRVDNIGTEFQITTLAE